MGSFGTIFKATYRGDRVVVRVSRKHDLQVKVESLRHPNLLQYYGCIQKELQMMLVMEFAEQGCLEVYLHFENKIPLYKESLKWSINIASAVQYLHESGIVARDINSAKVLFTGLDFTAKLSLTPEVVTLWNAPQGDVVISVGWTRTTAPEFLMNTSDKVLASFNLRAADVYSYAMLLFELWESKLSYHEKSQYQAIWSIMQGDRPAISDKAPKVVADLIQKCWSHDPNNRLDISIVLRALKQMPPTKPDGTPVINQDDIVMGSAPLAEGGFGAVYKAQWKSANNMIVAVKVGRCMPREINLMVSLKPHPNIIAFHGLVKVSEFETHIVMEFADKGSIYSHMKPFIDRCLRLAPALSLQWAMEIALGVQYLHRNDIVHRDLKPQNVLLVGEKLQAKITDFGSVRNLEQTAKASVFGSTQLYQAPESCPFEVDRVPVISKKYDTYSYALMLWELLTTKELFGGNKNFCALFFEVVLKNNRPDVSEIPGDFKSYLATLLQNCWKTDYKARPTFDDIVTALVNEEFTPCTTA